MDRSDGVGTASAAAPIAAVELEAHLAAIQLESRVEAVAGLGSEAAEQGGPPLLEQGLGRADADRLAGDRLPDRELAALLPAAASERLRLLDHVGAAQGTRPSATGRSRPPVSRAGSPASVLLFVPRAGRGRGFGLSPTSCFGSAAPSSGGRGAACGARRCGRTTGRPAPDFAPNRRPPPVGTGTSARTPESMSWRITSPAPSIVKGIEQHAALEELADLVLGRAVWPRTRARARTGSRRASPSSRSRACPRSRGVRIAGSRRAGPGRPRPRRPSG